MRCSPRYKGIPNESQMASDWCPVVLLPFPIEKLFRIPKVQRSIFQRPSDETPGVAILWLDPGNVVKSAIMVSDQPESNTARRQKRVLTHRESVPILADGCDSMPFLVWLKSKSQSSSWVLLEKSASTAPARVPVASKVEAVVGHQVKAAVLGISRSPTIAATTPIATGP